MNPFRRRAAESNYRAFSSGPFRALALFVIFAVSSSLQATVYTWRPSPPNNDWNVAANWQGNVAPPSDLVNTDIVYNSSTATFPSLNSPYSVHSLTFNDGTNGYAFSGGQLTLGTGGITQHSTYEMIFGNVVALGAAQTWNLAGGTGALTLAGGLATNGFSLTLNSVGTNIIGGAITGSGGLTKNGAGNLTLTGASTYTGATVVGGGTLTIANGGSLTYSVNNVVGPGLSVGPGATLAIGSGGSVNYGPSMGTPGQSLSFNGISASPALGTLSTGGSLAARFIYLGTISGGYATFTQTGGTLTTSDLGAFGLEVGNAGGSNGTYNLQGGSLTTYTSEIGASGTGLLAQTGGTHTVSQSLNVGASAGSNGTYTLAHSSAALSTRNTTIGLFGTGTFTQTGGTHTVSNNLVIGDSSGNPAVNATGTYNLSGDGVLSTVTTVLARSGTGSFNQTGGSHTVSNRFVVGDGTTGLNPTGAASYNLSGGTLSTGDATIALSNTGTLTQTGGSFTTNGSDLIIGRNSGSNGTYNLSGTGTLTTQSIVVGYDGTGKFVQSGGSFLVNGGLILGLFTGNGTYTLNGGSVTAPLTTVSSNTNVSTFTQNGGTHTTGTLYLGGGSGSPNATYNLNSGILSATEVTRDHGAGTFNFNGGTLRATGFTASFFHGLTNANVFSGGARIDSNGLNITVDQALLHASALGNSLDGGLIKSGSGTLTLAVPNTYTGGTTITGGILSVANDLFLGAPSGSVTISNGAQLAFTSASVLTDRTFNLSNGILAPAPAGTISYQGATVNGGTLGVGNHTLLANASFNGTRAGTGTVISQLPNTSAFNDVTLSGNSSFSQTTGATLNSTGDFIANPQTTITINGTFNTTGGAISGGLNMNNGGKVNQSGNSTPLYLDGTRGTTVNPGGQLNAAGSSTIELGGLLVNNGTQTGVLNVNLGGLAKGTGSFGTVNVNDGGRFSPGNSPGTATLGALSLGSGGRYEFELNSVHATAGNGADFLNVLGQLDIAAGTTPSTVFTIALVSLNSSNQAAALTDFDATEPYTFTLATAASGITGFSPNEFNVDTAGFANNLQGGSFAVAQNGNTLELQFHPVPEPSTWAMMLAGAGLLLTLQRRAPSALATELCRVFVASAITAGENSGLTKVGTGPSRSPASSPTLTPADQRHWRHARAEQEHWYRDNLSIGNAARRDRER